MSGSRHPGPGTDAAAGLEQLPDAGGRNGQRRDAGGDPQAGRLRQQAWDEARAAAQEAASSGDGAGGS